MIDLIASHPFLSTLALFATTAIGFVAYVGRDQEDATRAAYEAELHQYSGDEGDLQNFGVRAIEDEVWRDIA